MMGKEEIMEEQKLIDIMSHRTYDLAIVTTRLDEQINGQAVGWLTQASIKPPLIAIGLSEKNYTYHLIKESGVFAVNYLPKDRSDIVNLFGYKSGQEIDKFQNLEYGSVATGSPVLYDSAAFLDCKLANVYETGDHYMFIGEVIEADYNTLNWLTSKDFHKEAA